MLTLDDFLSAHSLGIFLCFLMAGILPRLSFLGAVTVVAVDEGFLGFGRHGAWLDAIHIDRLLDLLVKHNDLGNRRL